MFENDSHGGSHPADTRDITTYWCQRAGAGEHMWAIKYPAGAVSRLGHCYWNVSDTP
ncbi:hypothetical protein J6590_084909 [Homalodisca vitripennis]|nr:hypothetical protein J6590_084909 [Homalodisca vitripennis]